MQPPLVVAPPAEPDERMERLTSSARGWHTVQIAVLGFIGICGILHAPDAAEGAPTATVGVHAQA